MTSYLRPLLHNPQLAHSYSIPLLGRSQSARSSYQTPILPLISIKSPLSPIGQPTPLLKSKVQYPYPLFPELHLQEINRINSFIQDKRPTWEFIPAGMVWRYDKMAYSLPRTIEVFKDTNGKLRIMVLCKSKVSVKFNNSTYSICKDRSRIIGVGAYKVVKFAFDWDQNQLYANLVMHFTQDEMKEFPTRVPNLKNTIEIANRVAGKRGFASAYVGIHEYTKFDTNHSPILNIGFFMPYFPFGDLWRYCTGDKTVTVDLPMEHKDRIRYFLDIAVGLKTMKEMNIVHNDIKPHNYLIVCDQSGQFHLVCIDFDFAYDASKETRDELGTYEYESPERIFKLNSRNRPYRYTDTISPYSHDVWSAGICSLILLVGKNQSLLKQLSEFTKRRANEVQRMSDILIFAQQSDLYFKLINKEIDDVFEPLTALYKDKNAAAELNLIRQMLEADPKKRISAEQLYEQLTILEQTA